MIRLYPSPAHAASGAEITGEPRDPSLFLSLRTAHPRLDGGVDNLSGDDVDFALQVIRCDLLDVRVRLERITVARRGRA